MDYKQQQIKIGQMIKQARLDKDMSYYKLTKLTKVNLMIIKAIENGTSNYTIGSLIAIDTVLKSGVLNEIIFPEIEPLTD